MIFWVHLNPDLKNPNQTIFENKTNYDRNMQNNSFCTSLIRYIALKCREDQENQPKKVLRLSFFSSFVSFKKKKIQELHRQM
jgi:hypothetical protein